MRHVGDTAAAVVDGPDHRLGQLLEQVRQLVFFRSGITRGSPRLGGCGDAAVRVESAERAVAFLEDAASFFEEGLDVFDELFLVELILGSAVGLFDALQKDM